MRRLAFWTSSCLPPLQSPIRRSCSLLLDFLLPPLHLKVQSDALSCSFWTSSCLPSISKSNPPLLLAPFGLPRISPPLQSPICHSCSPLLDFLTSPLHFKVQSATLARSFWTSVHHPATLKSNPPLFLAPPRKKRRIATQSASRNPPISFRQFQSTSLNLHQPIPPSKAPAISATSESGTRTYLPSGTNHFPIGLSAPELTASTANFFPATQKNIIAASIAPSGQI